MPKCGPLDDKTAEALAHDLDWASRWRSVANSTLPPRERERLKSIELAARRLASLLAEYSETRGRIKQCWPHFPTASTPPDLRRTRRGLAALRKASGRAQDHRGGAAAIIDLCGSEQQIFIQQVAKTYLDHTGREPGVSLEAVQRTLGGPFVRFVQEASRKFCKGMKVPSAETIKDALAASKKTGVCRAEK